MLTQVFVSSIYPILPPSFRSSNPVNNPVNVVPIAATLSPSRVRFYAISPRASDEVSCHYSQPLAPLFGLVRLSVSCRRSRVRPPTEHPYPRRIWSTQCRSRPNDHKSSRSLTILPCDPSSSLDIHRSDPYQAQSHDPAARTTGPHNSNE